MKQITTIDKTFRQHIVFGDSDIKDIEIDLYFDMGQTTWFVDIKQESSDFEVKGLSVVASPNLLYTYKNIIDFGLLILSNDGLDPYELDCFETGKVSMIVLSKEDMVTIEKDIYNG